MAKGFKVVTTPPATEKKEDWWSVEKGKELIKGKSIVFCLPGRGVSYIFLKAFYNFALIWFKVVQAFKSHKIIVQW